MLASKDFTADKKLPPVRLNLMSMDQESDAYPTELVSISASGFDISDSLLH